MTLIAGAADSSSARFAAKSVERCSIFQSLRAPQMARQTSRPRMRRVESRAVSQEIAVAVLLFISISSGGSQSKEGLDSWSRSLAYVLTDVHLHQGNQGEVVTKG